MTVIKVIGYIFLTYILFRISNNYFNAAYTIIIELPDGKIRGRILKSDNGKNYYAFQEIPYAAPPIGENRFQLPKKPEKWANVLDTTRNTKICYQKQKKYQNLKISEDCLYINVYTPLKPGSDKLLPVLLWIHGGGLVNESGTFESCGPKYIMDHEIVVVTFNYRLGSFGFIGTDDNVVSTNLGLRDQRLAMEWVNENINLFGGNSNQVTLAGESAGSVGIGFHLIGPWTDNKKLFHAVIMQSGTPLSGILQQLIGTQTSTALKLGRSVDSSFTSNDTKRLLKVLQKADANDILKADVECGIIIEHDGPFSYPSLQAFLDGNYKRIPVLIGFNSEEWLLPHVTSNNALMECFDKNPAKLIKPGINMSPNNRTISGDLLKQFYTNHTSFMKNKGGFVKYQSDEAFTSGICKQVELASPLTPYYFYQFSYKGDLGGQKGISSLLVPGIDGVTHAEDLHYMWDDGTNDDLNKFPKLDRLMMQRFIKMWTNFVKYFNPTPVKDPLLDNFLWLPSESSTLRYMDFDKVLEMKKHPRQYQQVKEIKEKYMEPPFIVY